MGHYGLNNTYYKDMVIKSAEGVTQYSNVPGSSSTSFSVAPVPGLAGVGKVELLSFYMLNTISSFIETRNQIAFTDNTGSYQITIPNDAPENGVQLGPYLADLMNTANGGGDTWTVVLNPDGVTMNWSVASNNGVLNFSVDNGAGVPLGWPIDTLFSPIAVGAGGANSGVMQLGGPLRLIVTLQEAPPLVTVAPNIHSTMSPVVSSTANGIGTFTIINDVNFSFPIEYDQDKDGIQQIICPHVSTGTLNVRVTDEYGNLVDNRNAGWHMSIRLWSFPEQIPPEVYSSS